MDDGWFKSRTETESHTEWILENNFEPNIHPAFLVSTILYGNQVIDQKLKLSHLWKLSGRIRRHMISPLNHQTSDSDLW